jgi:hypothetical protein
VPGSATLPAAMVTASGLSYACRQQRFANSSRGSVVDCLVLRQQFADCSSRGTRTRACMALSDNTQECYACVPGSITLPAAMLAASELSYARRQQQYADSSRGGWWIICCWGSTLQTAAAGGHGVRRLARRWDMNTRLYGIVRQHTRVLCMCARQRHTASSDGDS